MAENDGPPASHADRSFWDHVNLDSVNRWVFLNGDRGLLSALLLVCVLVLSALLIAGGIITPTESEHVTTLAAALIGGMLPFITVVLAINQLILSEEFGTTGTFETRLEETRDFRRQVESHTGVSPSPVEPAAFLRVLIEAKHRAAREWRTAHRDCVDSSELAAAIETHVEHTTDLDAEAVSTLEDTSFGSFTVIEVIIRYNDSWQLQVLRRLRENHGDEFSDRDVERLELLEALLGDIHVSRQYFKTVYMQQELADLSKILLYVGFPTLLGGAFVVVGYDNLLALDFHPAVYWIIVTVTIPALFSPFAVLLFYAIRIATIARRTAADFGPFVLQQELPQEEKGSLGDE
ncbi:hypothetical protein [Natronosalvus vescus]|uniref:hypothetical protein n=1 Tax=Natronosalvus vescus TaxID=2953881 RepID=UPI0020916F85|nr:hypothetical protein [Natronosalvus vescus]